MGEGEKKTATCALQLRDQLVQSIYAMVDDDDEWPNLLRAMDAYFAHEASGSHELDATTLKQHMERANLLLEKLGELHLKSRHTDKVLDRIPMGIVLISREARILSINARASDLLQQIGAAHRDDRLQFGASGRQKEFDKALAAVAGGKTQGTPLSMDGLNLWVTRHGEGSGMQLAVYLGHAAGRSDIRAGRLMQHYGLTEKEAMLTSRLCDGMVSLEEAAESMGIGTGTARNHLKRIFAKTGAQRQADLIKLVLGNPILTLRDEEPVETTDSNQDSDTRVLRLPTGRTVSWAEYGDPKGRPVLLCHAVTGCRLLVPPSEEVLREHGLRLIVPDRAGYGLSTPAAGNCMQQWLKDIQLFLLCQGIRQCIVVGHSAGGAFAMELAARHPELVERLVLIGSVVPLTAASDVRHLLLINRMMIRLARNNRTAARAFMRLSLNVLLKKPESYFGLINSKVARLDREVLDDTELQRLLADSMRETIRQGKGQMLDELMYLATRWQLESGDIACPVDIWHGSHDRLTPPPLVRHFGTRLEHGSPIRWIEEAGYFLHFHQWPEIVAQLGKQTA